MDSFALSRVKVFDDWYASLRPLDLSFDAPAISPVTRLSTAWLNYIEAMNWAQNASLGPSMESVTREDYLTACGDVYEDTLVCSVPDENEQLVMVCRATYNRALVRLLVNYTCDRKLAAAGMDIGHLMADILDCRATVLKARAELLYITDATRSIALGAEPPVPPAIISSALLSCLSTT